MTAFAAILALDGRPPAALESENLAVALTAVTGNPTQSWRSGACELLASPLHPWEPPGPVTVDDGRLAVAGQVMLQGRLDLARAVQLPADAADLQIVAAAFARCGPHHLERLRGEYAYVLWDSRERRLLCARDPLGVRPVYVGTSSRLVVISNVIAAVVRHPEISNDLDNAALARFLACGRLATTIATPYKAVRLVPEGHTIAIGGSGCVTLVRHWQPPPPIPSRHATNESLLSGYRDVLRNAVGDRIAGRRCTVFLSGGMDSTTLSAVGVGCASEMRAVTFGYRRCDTGEVPLARSVAERLSIPLDVVCGDADTALEAERTGEGPALPVDEPSLSNWRAGLRVAASFSTLAVYGEDGDALFASPGGSTLLSTQSASSVIGATIAFLATERRLPYLGLRLRERLGWATPRPMIETPWLTADARHLAELPEEKTLLGQPLEPLDAACSSKRAWERLLCNVPHSFAMSISPDVTRQRLALTLPLMDTRLVEFVMSVPPIPWCQNKRLARTAFAGMLPSSVLTKRKTPASDLDATLVDAWRAQHLRTALHSSASAITETGWVERERWTRALESGTPGVTLAALRVLLLDAWLSRTSRRLACTA